MLKKSVLVLIPLIAAAGPFAVFTGSAWWSRVRQSLKSNQSPALALGPVGPSEQGQQGGENGTETPPWQGVGGRPIGNLSEIFRFDVSPQWIVRRWPRVSSGLAQLQLQGYRVPLVTGTRQDDLAGALTYYFNSNHQVQRITFQGTTGDCGRLVRFLVAHYGFQQRQANGPAVLIYAPPGPEGPPRGWLEIRTAGIVRSSQPCSRYHVALRIDRDLGRP